MGQLSLTTALEKGSNAESSDFVLLVSPPQGAFRPTGSRAGIEPSGLREFHLTPPSGGALVDRACKAISILYRWTAQSNLAVHDNFGRHNDHGNYYPSWLEGTAKLINRALELRPLPPGGAGRFLDLGSGDGRVLLLAALGFGLEAVGYELDPHLIKASGELVTQNAIPRVQIHQASFLTADFAAFDMLYYFDHGSRTARLTPPPRSNPDYISPAEQFFGKLGTLRPGSQLMIFCNQTIKGALAKLPFLEKTAEFPTHVLNGHGQPETYNSCIYTRNRQTPPADVRPLLRRGLEIRKR